MVLLHGGGQTRHSWRRTARRLADEGWYALSVDLRGHGDSGWSPDGDYSFDRFTDDVQAVRAVLDQPPVFVGASLGGISALSALGRDTGIARGLVLVDVSPFLQRGGTGRITEFMQAAPNGFGSLEEAADAVSAYLPHRERPRDVSGLRKNLREADGRWFWHWDPVFVFPPANHAPHRRLGRPSEQSLSRVAATLRLPTLLVRGGQSDVLSREDARRFLDLVPHADYCDVVGAHHMVTGDDNAVFDERIIEFLRHRVRPRLELTLALGQVSETV
nr:alpha/beta hydrolase [Frankia canadensis]